MYPVSRVAVPVHGAFERALPALDDRDVLLPRTGPALLGQALGHKHLIDALQLLQLLSVLPKAGLESGDKSSPQTGHLAVLGSGHLPTEQVCRQLHDKVVGGHAAVHSYPCDWNMSFAQHRLIQLLVSEGDGLQNGTDQMAFGGGRFEAHEGGTGFGIVQRSLGRNHVCE